MNEHKPYFPNKIERKRWTLFLDRDGVINQYIPRDYAKTKRDFIIREDVFEALAALKSTFGRVVLVTNQQGIGKEVMSEADLENVHLKLYDSLKKEGIPYFDATFFAPYLKNDNHDWRKPSKGMVSKAKAYFPEIDLDKSILIGDSLSDMELGRRIGAVCVRIINTEFNFDNQDYLFSNLKEFVDYLS